MFSVVQHSDTFDCLYLVYLFTVYLRCCIATPNVSGHYWCI